MQEKSDGLLEVMMLISGEHRKRNIPGASIRKGAEKLLKKAGFASPALSSPGSSIRHWTPGRRTFRPASRKPIAKYTRPTRDLSMSTISESKAGVFISGRSALRDSTHRAASTKTIAPVSVPKTVARTLTRGKVSHEVLEEVFGPNLLGIVDAARTQDDDSSTTARRRPRINGSTTDTSRPAEGGGELEAKQRDAEDDYNDERELAEELTGSDTTPGKLQVVVSGPTGFVAFVETILGEMGIPSSAIVLLD
ncbi:unnamed protein product [Ectocarpus fasciculatus]